MSTIFNPTSTSGIGFKLEHYVQASYLASLLLQTPVPFGNSLIVTELNFQAKLKANTDDIIVHFSNHAKFLVQSKKGFEINFNKVFDETIEFLWKDFNSNSFDKAKDKFVIATDILSKADADDGLSVLEWARFSKDFEDYYTKLKANKEKLAKYKYFLKAAEKANGSNLDKALFFEFLKTISLKSYDYLQSNSKDKEVLKWYLKPFLKDGNNSDNALLKLIEYAEKCNQHGGTIDISNIKEEIKNLFDLTKSPTISHELNQFINKSNSQLEHTIYNAIDGLHIDRSEQLQSIHELLPKKNIIFISGEGGVGKSGLVKDFLREIYNIEGGFIFFKADQLDRSSLAYALADIGVQSDFGTLLSQWRLLPKLTIYVDSFEKLYEAENKEAFIEFLEKIKEINDVKLLLTCRTYAIETLRRKYNIPKDSIGIVNLKPLSEEQLNEIANQKEELRSIISNVKLRQLTTLPFYLNIASQVIESLDDEAYLNENQFKKALWDSVVEKKGSVKTGMAKKRADVFSTLILKRAIEKTPYSKIDDYHLLDVVGDLEKDELLIKHLKLDLYAPAHDVFEDMVVVRHLNELFQNKENSIQFLDLIDTNPVFRRGIHLWIQELIIEQPDEAKIFLFDIFSSNISLPIIDEILIGILGSNQAYSLIKQNVEIFLKSNTALFFKAFRYLKVAYTEPYQSEHPERKVKAFGSGWTALLRILDEYYNEAIGAFNIIRVDLLKYWTFQFNQDDYIPEEGKIVAKHCLLVLKEKGDIYKLTSKKEIFEILFFVAFYATNEIEDIITNAVKARRTNTSEFDHLAGFYDKFFQMLLTETFRCINVYKLFPELIIELAKIEWYKNDVLDEYDTDYTESSFGFVEYPYKYFSASANQTPFKYLFKFHPSLTLPFLIELCNRSIGFYLKSVYAKQSQTKKIPIKLPRHPRIFLYGDATLWSIYRGSSHSPYLIQSALMAFESYLLDCAATDTLPEDFLENVILKSNSVLMLSVLLSIAMAYPLIFKEEIFALLKSRKVFAWDLSRSASDTGGINPSTIGNDLYYTRERFLSNQLGHRKSNLEHLVTKLQFYYNKQACKLIDEFKSKVHPDDNLWQLALVRMDIRNTTIEIKEEENQIHFNPNPLPDNLQKHVESWQEERSEDSIAISIRNWSNKILDEKEQASFTYEVWKQKYEEVKLLKLNNFISHFDPTLKIVTIGIQHFSKELTEEEKKFCVQILTTKLKTTIQELKLGFGNHTLDLMSDNILRTAPILLSSVFDGFIDREDWIETILDSLLLLIHDSRKHLINGIKRFCWTLDHSTAEKCFQILLKLSKNQRSSYKSFRWRNLPKEEKIENTDKFLVETKTFVDIKPEDLSLKEDEIGNVLEALQCVPYEKLNNEYREFLEEILFQISDFGNLEDSNKYEFIQGIETLMGNYFVSNSNEKSANTLLTLLSLRSKQFQFVMDVLKWMVWVGHDNRYPEQLWFHIEVVMNYFFQESPTIGLLHIVLLEPLTDIHRCNKLPESGPSRPWHELIISKFASDKNVLQAAFKLLIGVGSTYQPICLNWLMKSLPDQKSYESNLNLIFATEYINEFVQQLYDNHIEYLYKNKDQLNYFIMLLNILIDGGSTSAFRMRDELI